MGSGSTKCATEGAFAPLHTSSVVELRQYTLHPGRRDVLIDIFERDFIDAQERTGISVIGQFKDLDNPDKFVWLRGFPDMQSRPRMLESFYSGPEWKANRDRVNELLVDSDNVLLLRNAWEGSGFLDQSDAPTDRAGRPLFTANIFYLNHGEAAEFAHFFRSEVEPVHRKIGAPCIAAFLTESSPNNYPRLPVREGENVLVSFHLFDSLSAYTRHVESANVITAWRNIRASIGRGLAKPIQTLKLTPTSRSRLR